MKRPIPILLALAFMMPLSAIAARALDLPHLEIRRTVELPLAVTEVVAIGVPVSTVERVVVDLNRARVPTFHAVEVVRYSAFPLVLERHEVVGLELGLPFELEGLDMSILLRHHVDRGLIGPPLARAVFADLHLIGFAVTEARIPRIGPSPVVGPRFVFYLQPGFRIDTDRGVFRGRPFLVPPGHAKHGPFGPHPTPGHVRHDRRGGPPGHAGDPPGHVKKKERGKPDRVGPPGKGGKGPKPKKGKPDRIGLERRLR